MSTRVILMLLPVLVLLLILAAALAMRPYMTNRLYAGTGLDDWRRVAAGLPWRDRWAVYRANSFGRAAPAALAAHAVQRGEMMIACAEAVRYKLRKAWLVLGVSSMLLCGLNVALLIAGERAWHNWLQVITHGWLAILWLAMPGLQRRQLTKLSRSVERNRELVAARDNDAVG